MTDEELKTLRTRVEGLNERIKTASQLQSTIEQCEHSLKMIDSMEVSESDFPFVKTDMETYNGSTCFPYTDTAMYIEAARKGTKDVLRYAKKRFAEL